MDHSLFDANHNVVFNAEEHSYVTKAGQKLISATQLLSIYKPPFDADGSIIKRCALKRNITVEALQKEWDNTKQEGMDKGHQLHSDIEYFVNTGKIKKNQNAHIVKQFKKIKFKGKLFSEQLIYSLNDGLAGTIDLVELFEHDIINIYDFKTNKKFSKFSPWKTAFLPPIEHLYVHELNTFSLQLSLYGYMAEELGFWVNNLMIFYINPKTDQIEHHNIPYRRNDIKTILEHYAYYHQFLNSV